MVENKVQSVTGAYVRHYMNKLDSYTESATKLVSQEKVRAIVDHIAWGSFVLPAVIAPKTFAVAFVTLGLADMLFHKNVESILDSMTKIFNEDSRVTLIFACVNLSQSSYTSFLSVTKIYAVVMGGTLGRKFSPHIDPQTSKKITEFFEKRVPFYQKFVTSATASLEKMGFVVMGIAQFQLQNTILSYLNTAIWASSYFTGLAVSKISIAATFFSFIGNLFCRELVGKILQNVRVLLDVGKKDEKEPTSHKVSLVFSVAILNHFFLPQFIQLLPLFYACRCGISTGEKASEWIPADFVDKVTSYIDPWLPSAL